MLLLQWLRFVLFRKPVLPLLLCMLGKILELLLPLLLQLLLAAGIPAGAFAPATAFVTGRMARNMLTVGSQCCVPTALKIVSDTASGTHLIVACLFACTKQAVANT